MAKGALVINKYYSDSGLKYMQNVLTEKLLHHNIELCQIHFYAGFGASPELNGFDFVLFFDKDIYLAHFLEAKGMRLINSAGTVEACDDKLKTYHAVSHLNIAMPKTICAPLMFDINDSIDTDFLVYVEASLNYPIIVKENVGSQGRQVYLATNYTELNKLYSRLKKIPHHYQEFIASSKGEDIRVYIVGKKAVAAAVRFNTTDFRSNVSMGADLNVINLSECLKNIAEQIADSLKLEYGSVDFLKGNDGSYIFLEANSSAYFKAIESKGVNISDLLVNYIAKTVGVMR